MFGLIEVFVCHFLHGIEDEEFIKPRAPYEPIEGTIEQDQIGTSRRQ